MGVATLGRIFENQSRRVLYFPSTSDEGVGKGKGAAVPSESEAEEEEEEDEDYLEQQYPLQMTSTRIWKNVWQLWKCKECLGWISKS